MDSSSSGRGGDSPRTCSRCNRTAGQGAGLSTSSYCRRILCGACDHRVLQCDKCDHSACDSCLRKGKGQDILACACCSTVMCEVCIGKVVHEGGGDNIVSKCNRCHYCICEDCRGNCRGDRVFDCDYCGQICENCCDRAPLCDECNSCACNRCKYTLSCNLCYRVICKVCSDNKNKYGGGTGQQILQCHQCDRISCNCCMDILACDCCDKVICQVCSGKGYGGGKGDTVLRCAKCNLFSCDKCTVVTRCNRFGVYLCASCQGCDIFAVYRASCQELRRLKSIITQTRLATAGYKQQIDELSAGGAQHKRRLSELSAQLAERSSSSLQPLLQVCPIAAELTKFLTDVLPELKPGMSAVVPVQALRWTHAGINAQLAFGDEHEHAEESIFKLFEQLFRRRLSSLELTEQDPLPVYIHRGPDNHLGLYSRRNRRLTTLLMYQGLVREEVVKVHVIVRSPKDPKWRKDWQKSYDNSTGLSIQPHEGRRARACHHGRPLFKGSHAIVADALDQARQRPHSTSTQQALELVADRLRQRPSRKAEDEMSATFTGSVA